MRRSWVLGLWEVGQGFLAPAGVAAEGLLGPREPGMKGGWSLRAEELSVGAGGRCGWGSGHGRQSEQRPPRDSVCGEWVRADPHTTTSESPWLAFPRVVTTSSSADQIPPRAGPGRKGFGLFSLCLLLTRTLPPRPKWRVPGTHAEAPADPDCGAGHGSRVPRAVPANSADAPEWPP